MCKTEVGDTSNLAENLPFQTVDTDVPFTSEATYKIDIDYGKSGNAYRSFPT